LEQTREKLKTSNAVTIKARVELAELAVLD
jgi:hypothetical protein